MATYTLQATRRRYDVTANPAPTISNRLLSGATAAFALAGGAIQEPFGYVIHSEAGSFAVTGAVSPLLRYLVSSASSASFALAGSSAEPRLGFSIATEAGGFTATGSAAGVLHSALLPAAHAGFGIEGATAQLPRSLLFPPSSASFALSGSGIGINQPGLSRPAGASSSQPESTYGGSSPSYPSFLRPQFVNFNSAGKARDLGTLDNLLGIFKGQIGSQDGTNTIYITVRTTGAADIRITKNTINRYTDQYISVGILDANRKPLPLTATGYAYANEIVNTPQSEFETQLPAGVYYFTVSSSQWQSIPFSVNAQVFRYIELSGTAEVAAPCVGRLPLVKTGGLTTLTNESTGTILAPSALTLAQGAATLAGLPSLTITIMRGTALLQATPYGQLKQTLRISGTALMTANPSGTLTVTSPYGY
jgi:hypothetical protein